MKRRWISLTAALCLLMITGNAVAEETVVRVGSVCYTRQEVQTYWNNIATSLASMGADLSDAEIAQYRDSVIESFVDMGVIENKFVEFGFDQMDEKDRTEIEALTDDYYNEALEIYAQSIAKQYDVSLEEGRECAPTFLKLNRYTRETARNQAETEIRQRRVLEAVTADLDPITEGEVKAYYESEFVEPTQKAYEGNVADYETSVLLYGSPSFYVPADYRRIRHIYLSASEETTKRIAEISAETEEIQAALETASNRIYGLKVLEENTDQAQAEYDALEDKLADLTAERDSLHDRGIADNAETIAEIQRRLAAGEDFETLLEEYNQDADQTEEGYLVCAQSVLWDEGFKTAALALEKVGDVSDPVCTEGGVHILCWSGEIPAGEIPLEGDLLRQMTDMADSARKYAVLSAFIDTWKSDYEIETDASMLETPEILTAQ